MGGHHRQIGGGQVKIAQEGQVGAVGPVHHQNGPVGAAHRRQGGQI